MLLSSTPLILWVGRTLHLAPLQGAATLRLALPRTLKPDQVEEIQESRDGVVAALRRLEAAVTVTPGPSSLGDDQLCSAGSGQNAI